MEFKELLKLYVSNNFCVVGNSPSEIGSNNGALIDSFETVIRFNDFSKKYKKDYGSKANIWVRASNDLVIETLDEKLKENFNLILIRAKKRYNELSVNKLIEQKKIFEYFPIDYEIILSKKIKAIPSTGLLFLFILKENGFKLTRKNIFGFSFFSQNDLVKYKTHHYFDLNSNFSLGITSARHNWENEKKFYQKYIIGS